MNQLMRGLQAEHKGLRQLLALLQKKVEMLEQDIPPKYSLIEDTIDYIENYIDRYHHPKEDIIFNYLIEHGFDSKDLFKKMIHEHKNIYKFTEPLKATLHSILLDIIIPKETTIEQLKHFIDAEKSHLEREESQIFPLAMSLLQESDWQEIAKLVPPQSADPLFGERVRAEYQELYQRLTENEVD